MSDTLREAAKTIVSQMSEDDRLKIEIRGAERWREGISMMLIGEWEHLDADELLAEIESLVDEEANFRKMDDRANETREIHLCGGRILVVGIGDERWRYCGRCRAYTEEEREQEREVPRGTDRAANIGAWHRGDVASPND